MKIALAALIELSYAHWGPPLAAEGLPGTEEAILHMAESLAALGHEVHVLTNCGPYAGLWNGVRWIDLPTAGPLPAYDVAVVTGIDLLDRFAGSGRRYLWLHVHLPPDEVADALDRVHKIMPLSVFSRLQCPGVPDDRVFVTRNGIVPAQFDQPAGQRDPHRLVYGSDYDRGLLLILRLWPEIRRAVPDVSLHVFYGWTVFERKLAWYRDNDAHAFGQWTKLRRIIEELLEQDGIVHLGRIGHDAVAREFLEAGIWAYPCQFPETSCITAMKAQAAGAVPVVIPTAALRETVRWGLRTRRTPPDYRSIDRDLATEWLHALAAALQDTAFQEQVRQTMIPAARVLFDWRTIAAEWAVEFAGG